MSEEFWMRVRKSDGCWEWTGPLNANGYGVYARRSDASRIRIYAHRQSFLLVKGHIPPNRCVLHACDNRRCVNPDHLWLGTRAENMADMIAKGRGRWPGAKRHVPFRGRKLTADAARAIKASIEPCSVLASRHGVCAGTVKLIRMGRRWANV